MNRAIFIAALAVFALAACSKEQPKSAPAPQAAPAPAAVAPAAAAPAAPADAGGTPASPAAVPADASKDAVKK